MNNNTDNYNSFQHRDNCDNQGDVTFTDKDNNTVESIAMVQNHSSQWMTKNQVIMPSTISKYVIHKVTTRGELQRKQQEETTMNQQQSEQCHQQNMEKDIQPTNINNNVTQPSSPPPSACGNEGTALSPPPLPNNNNNDNADADLFTKHFSPPTVKTEPPTKTKPTQQLELWH